MQASGQAGGHARCVCSSPGGVQGVHLLGGAPVYTRVAALEPHNNLPRAAAGHEQCVDVILAARLRLPAALPHANTFAACPAVFQRALVGTIWG